MWTPVIHRHFIFVSFFTLQRKQNEMHLSFNLIAINPNSQMKTRINHAANEAVLQCSAN